MNIREYIKSHILVTDGAMGTYYSEITGDQTHFCEMANITNPQVIGRIHTEYMDAGARLIRTNTFSANRYALKVGRDEQKRVIERGYEIAEEAAGGRDVFVGASIGPIRETGEEEYGDILGEYKFIADTLIGCGARIFVFETFSSHHYLVELARFIKDKAPEAFVIAQFAFSADGLTREGYGVRTIFDEIKKSGLIDVYGFNCGASPSHLLGLVGRLSFGDDIVSVLPNASYPEVINERTVYVNNPDYFAMIMASIVEKGIRIVGGCCGTTPSHIKALANRVGTGGMHGERAGEGKARKREEALRRDNRFFDKLNNGEFVVAVELDPPFDTKIDKLMDSAKACAEFGVDLITVADSPRGIARVDSLMIAAKVKREAGIDAMPHMCCRDKNVNALRSGILAAHIEGIRNILAVTGDPILESDKVTTKSVFNLNSFKLIELMSQMNDETFGDDSIAISGALNLSVLNKEIELGRMTKKLEKGASFFLTQPIFDDGSIETLKWIRNEYGAKVISGIMPLMTYKNALFLNNEVPGFFIPEDCVSRFSPGMTREEGEEAGIGLAVELAERMRPYVDGFYMITPFDRSHVVLEVLKRLKQKGIY